MANLQIVLFYVLLITFIFGTLLVFTIQGFRKGINCILMIAVLISLIYISQKDGVLKYKIGPLETLIQKGGGSTTDFKLKNPTNEKIQETIRLSSSSQIRNINIDKGSEFFDILDGGVGNNYIIYKVNIPANGIASGSVVSADTVVFGPTFSKDR